MKTNPWGSKRPIENANDLISVAKLRNKESVLTEMLKIFLELHSSAEASAVLAKALHNMAEESHILWIKAYKPCGGEDMNK